MDDKDSENKGIICEHLNEVKLYIYIYKGWSPYNTHVSDWSLMLTLQCNISAPIFLDALKTIDTRTAAVLNFISWLVIFQKLLQCFCLYIRFPIILILIKKKYTIFSRLCLYRNDKTGFISSLCFLKMINYEGKPNHAVINWDMSLDIHT